METQGIAQQVTELREAAFAVASELAAGIPRTGPSPALEAATELQTAAFHLGRVERCLAPPPAPPEYLGYAPLVLDRLAKQACELVGAEQSCIVVFDRDDPGVAITAAAQGVREEVLGNRFDASASGDVLAGPGSVTACQEIETSGSVRGVLTAASSEPGRRFTRRELKVLNELAQVAGDALGDASGRERELGHLRDRLQEMLGSLRAHDEVTGCHSMAVVEIVLAVGERLGLGSTALLELELAALLHDVGKVAVPVEILSKPGPLDAREREIVERHPVAGAEILRQVPGLQPVATIIRYHHERWDGGGYPDGLKGERIPLASRIVCVCDAFQAMTSDRPYRPSLGEAAALEELRRCAGTQFDPHIVRALLEIMENRSLSDAGLLVA